MRERVIPWGDRSNCATVAEEPAVHSCRAVPVETIEGEMGSRYRRTLSVSVEWLPHRLTHEVDYRPRQKALEGSLLGTCVGHSWALPGSFRPETVLGAFGEGFAVFASIA